MALTDNLISYWKMEGNSNDSVGSNNGTDTNISYGLSTGKILQGAALTAQTSGGGIDVGNAADLRTTGDFTISMWIYLTSDAESSFFSGGGQSTTPFNNFALWYFPTQGILWRIRDTAGNLPVNIIHTFSTTGAWTHIVARISGTAASLYVNNVSAGTGTFSGTRNSLTNNNIIGGGFQDSGERIMDGNIDEVGFWSRAITTDEIAELYNGGAGLTYPFTSANTSAFFQLF